MIFIVLSVSPIETVNFNSQSQLYRLQCHSESGSTTEINIFISNKWLCSMDIIKNLLPCNFHCRTRVHNTFTILSFTYAVFQSTHLYMTFYSKTYNKNATEIQSHGKGIGFICRLQYLQYIRSVNELSRQISKYEDAVIFHEGWCLLTPVSFILL